MAQLLGIVDIVWKGRRIDAEKGAKFKRGGIKNNAVTYGRKVGRAQEFEAGSLTATIPLARGQRLGDVFSLDEGELQILFDTGQTYVASDAFITNNPEATGGEGGKIEVSWAFGETEEII